MDRDSVYHSPFSPEDRYRQLVDAVTDYAIYMLDPEGRVASWNPGAEHLFGFSESEILGRHFSSFYTAEDCDAGMPARTLETAIRDGRFNAETWRVRKDGSRFAAQIAVDPILGPQGALLGFAKVTQDLTERRAAEVAMRRNEERFGLLVQGVTDYAIYMLDPNGIITNWNAGAQRIKGYAPEDVIGSHFSRFYRAEDREGELPARALATSAREGRYEAEGWRVRKDGTEFWAHVVIDSIRDASDQILGYAKVTRDVTEKRDARVALERAREALFQSQKLDAIGQLTGGIAHDFNNLLMVVTSSLQLLKRHLPGDVKAGRLIDNALHGARRGVTLTQRMLAFAKRQELAPVGVHVPDLVEGMRELLERSLGPTIRIHFDFQCARRPVLVDANQVELAILNLAVNARDAMPSGGRLTVSTGCQMAPDPVEGCSLARGEYVVLSVADTGIGMSAETLARAMEPFYTTKGTGGTGLGLPMIHGLAAQSGGQFLIHSTESNGTTAELWLPVAPDGTLVQPRSEPPAWQRAERPPMVVVAVDDDALVLAGTVALLEDLGHTVLPANSAAQGLQLVERHPEVALVVTDHAMPHMTGAELAKRLRQVRPRLPVILATGFAEGPHGMDAIALRLAKPFDQDQLDEAIREAFARTFSAAAS